MNKKNFIYLIAALSILLLTGGCLASSKKVENMQVPRLMIEARGMDYSGSAATTLNLPVSGSAIQVESQPIVSEFDIINVEMVKVDLGLALMLQLSDTGRRELYRRSVTNKGNRVVLTSNDEAIGARVLDGPITDGKFYTFVEIDDAELGQFVLDLKASITKLQKGYKY